MASYLLVYDAASIGTLQAQFHSFIKQHKLVHQWSQPFLGLYILKSSSDVLQLTATFDEFLPRTVHHVVAPVSPPIIGGILPGEIWQWLAAPETSHLGGLLSTLIENDRQP